MFLRKTIKGNTRQLDRFYRSMLSDYGIEASKSGGTVISPPSNTSSKLGATATTRKALYLIVAAIGLIGGVIAWQVLRPSPAKTPSPMEQQATSACDTMETIPDVSPQMAETNNAPVETKDFSSTNVTFDENIVFDDEHKKSSNMDSIKNIGLAAMMVLAMDTAAPAQVDTAGYQAPNKTETVTSSPKDQSWKTQFKRHEFTLGVGDPARINYFRNRAGTTPNYFPEVWLQNRSYFGNVYTTCPIALGYRFRVLKWLWVGGDVSYCGFFGSFKDNYTDQKVGDYRDHFISIMPAVRFSYLNREHFTLYSGIAGGVALEYSKSYPDYKAHNNHIAFQLTLLGLSAGSQRWFGFAELGCGYKGGYVNAGVGFRFNAKK